MGIRSHLHGLASLSAFAATAVSASPPLLSADQAKLQERALYRIEFQDAAREFHVPSRLLRAIAFAETRWNAIVPGPPGSTETPPVYGPMGLRDDDFFGHTLRLAAGLLHLDRKQVAEDPVTNIRGAAAVLANLQLSHGRQGRSSNDVLDWEDTIRRYSGLSDSDSGDLYAEEVFRVLHDGYRRSGIDISPSQEPERTLLGVRLRSLTPIDWDPSPNFNPGQIRQKYVVIHTTEGSFASAVAWLKNPQSEASAHYVIRSSDGYIKSLVKETDRAWHARCWDPVAVGVEHEGFVETADYYTDSMYKSSAALVKSIIGRYAIPADDMHIFGHDFWMTQRYKDHPPADLPNCNDHTDPGRFWDWNRYLGLLAN